MALLFDIIKVFVGLYEDMEEPSWHQHWFERYSNVLAKQIAGLMSYFELIDLKETLFN